MRYYLLIRRKGTKKWIGAIPARSGVSLRKLRIIANLKRRSGLDVKIVSKAMLMRLLRRMMPSRVRRRSRRVHHRKHRRIHHRMRKRHQRRFRRRRRR